jgi:hypothetical protein
MCLTEPYCGTVTINISGALCILNAHKLLLRHASRGRKIQFEPRRVKLAETNGGRICHGGIGKKSRDVMRRLEINNEIFTACIDKRIEYQDHRGS